jgi:phenylalanyl-tRNA synthetase beta chain
MRILHSWLENYIDFRLKAEQLAEKLGMLGLEVEGFERLDAKYSGFVVGKVLTVSKHPNADKLSVCSIDIGKAPLQIVCGAPNVTLGQKVVVGTIGATVPRDQHDPAGNPFVLSKVKIRGVESFGMICSEYELDLGKNSDGILVLDASAKIGQPLAEYFGLDDTAYDVEITPNRPDWLSHYGVAREIGVIVNRKAKLPTVEIRESRVPIAKHLTVKVVDKKNCLRFAARMIRGVKIGPSPRWLQNVLRNVGLRPRNNVVDVTNYVMLECGQPLHAFDFALMKNGKIVVRQTQGQGKFTTLDGKEHQLPLDAVMVCDSDREVSIAGIMGGANSEINDDTVDVVLESACWNPASIRQTRRALGISTDASQRFERGTDPEGVWYALQRATQLVHELAGGEVLRGTIDILSKPIRPREIDLRTDRVNAILGTSLPTKKVARLLRPLNVEPAHRKSRSPRFKIPTYRVDLEREIDLIEEVARVHGYDNIEEKSAALIDFSHPFAKGQFVDDVRQILIGFGYHEALSYSLQDMKTAEMDGSTPVRLLNLSVSENAAMRTSLVPGLLASVARNASFGTTDVRIFEIGKVYSVDESPRPKTVENFLEEERVCLLLSGTRAPRHWSSTSEPYDAFDLKGEVSDLLQKFALDKSGFISYSTSNRLADNAVAIEINGSYAGYFGSVKKVHLKTFSVEQGVFVAEFSLEALRSANGQRKYVPPPKYPRVRRDVAFILEGSTPAEAVERVIRDASSSLLQSVELFDLYRGENLGIGKKSVAFGLDLVSTEKTLTEEEIEAEVRRIVEAVVSKTGGVLRAV